jgi:hypothetical protein
MRLYKKAQRSIEREHADMDAILQLLLPNMFYHIWISPGTNKFRDLVSAYLIIGPPHFKTRDFHGCAMALYGIRASPGSQVFYAMKDFDYNGYASKICFGIDDAMAFLTSVGYIPTDRSETLVKAEDRWRTEKIEKLKEEYQKVAVLTKPKKQKPDRKSPPPPQLDRLSVLREKIGMHNWHRLP